MFKLRNLNFFYKYSCFSKHSPPVRGYMPISVIYQNKIEVRKKFYSDIIQQSNHLYNTTSGVVDPVNSPVKKEISDQLYDVLCEETLESLTEFFEELLDKNPKMNTADISYSSGVLTLNLGQYGTYVINRQTPNKQIWLSSPVSGPKRYDYIVEKDCWCYKHENICLHELLEKELMELFKEKIDFSQCAHSTKLL